MSDSDLDFESADEGGEDVDIELSDLSDDDEKSAEKKTNDDTLVKSADEDKKVEETADGQKESEEPVVERQKEVERDEPQKPMEQDKNEIEVKSSTGQPEEKFDVEGDDEIDRLLEDMNINEEEAVKHEPAPVQLRQEPKAEAQSVSKEAEVVSKKVQVVSTGWDDTEFSDVEDDNNDSRSAPVKDETAVQPKPVEGENLVPSNKTKDIASLFSTLESKPEPKAQSGAKQGGWSWSSGWSTVLSSATALLETVEGAIGAPDPAELAAKVVKAKSENEKIQEELATNPDAKVEQEEKPSSGSFNDWDTNEWFTLPKQLNKLATTVMSLSAEFASI